MGRSTRPPRPPRVAFEDVAFRWSSYDTPLWARPNRTAQRWNRAGEGPTQYLSLSTDGAWAELIRAEELRSPGDVRAVSMPMWVLRIRETHIADYRTFERAEAAGFPPDALVDDDRERCRAEGTRLRASGFRGVVTPSAAMPDCMNLTLFGSRLAVDWECPDEKRLASFVPVKQMAVGHPPDGLLDQVRHRGTTHRGYAAYRRRT